MKGKAVFPGSFDPVTLGHEELILRAAKLFDKIYVAMGVNKSKRYCFDYEIRKQLLENSFGNIPNIEVVSYEGLTVDLCRKLEIKVIVRGLRSVIDFEYESEIAACNAQLMPGLETLFLSAAPGFSHYSSTVVREIYLSGGDISGFVPSAAAQLLANK